MKLAILINNEEWPEVINRITTYPEEVRSWANHSVRLFLPITTSCCDGFGYLPIHRVCEREKVPAKVIETLIEAHPQCVRHKTNSLGLLPLHVAVRYVSLENTDVVKVLLRHYMEGAAVKDDNGQMALSYHVLYCPNPLLEIIKMLVEAHPEFVKMSHTYNWYPLHHAATRGNWEISKYLLDMYPDALRKRDRSGQTPSDIAAVRGYQKLKDQLCQEEEQYFGNLDIKDNCIDESMEETPVKKTKSNPE